MEAEARFVSDGDGLYARLLEPESGAASGQGSTATLVLLHPTPLNHSFWRPAAILLPGYRRIVQDLRAHGRSPLGTAPTRSADGEPVLTMAQLARDTLALLDHLEIERAVFVGCSIGGYILYELWRVAPQRVAGLVFSGSKPQADTDAERAKREEWIAKMEPARLGLDAQPTPEFIDAMLAALLSEATRRDRPELGVEARLMMEQVRPEAVQAIQRGLRCRPDSRGTAATVSVPSCVLAGEEDASSTPADLAELHALLLKSGAPSSYHLLADAGHYAPFEQPAAVAGIVDAFCRSLPERAT